MKARRIAILGASESGKSFLGSGIIRGQWRFDKRVSCVFDPWKGRKKHPWSSPTDWGPGAWVDGNFERWKRAALGTEGKCVLWDEATTNGGRDRDNVGLFTEIRHNHPVLVVMGHRYEALLPTMRVCLTDLITAKCMPDDAEKMASEFMDPEIAKACHLNQYEFLWKQPYQPIRIVRFTPAEIMRGIQI
jgi:hypothetical protein